MEKREIKFRAWHADSKLLLDVIAIAFQNKQIVVKWQGAERAISDKQFVLMQYTGLKDKNGIEIFEGDILLWNNNGLECRAVITFESGSFMLTSKEGERFYPYVSEVIGNVYQHPKLCLNY